MRVIIRRLSHRVCAMLFVLIILVAAGVEVSATSPRRYQPSQCPSPAERDAIAPLLCGPNSHFERCSKECPPQSCSALIDPYWLCESRCCKAECRCNDGYYKDDRTGRCISRDECLAQCGPFERFVKNSPECQRTCANYKVTGPRSLCKPFTGCVCEEGRVRLNDNATGTCVPTKECPRRQCPLNEHYEKCPSVCVKESCMSRNPDYKCLLPAIPLPCKPRCICDKGYLRNHLGQCIPKNHCPIKRCPINEVWRCASMCPRDSCKRLEPGFKCPPEVTSVCIPACVCKDGFMRDDRGRCIPKELCPPSVRCGINEVAVKCKAYPPLTCESVYTLYKKIDNPPCVPGCDCRPGYLRNKRNICVPSEFCPTVPHSQCGPRQEYKECGSTCERSCSDLDNPPQICPDVCVKGCFCKDGYLKDEHGNCVTRSECPLPICNKPNEVAKDCGSYCEIKTCEDYNRTDIVCPAVCVRGCFCRKGYVRNAYGVCIRPEKCPAAPVCLQDNEEYLSCGSSCPDSCLNYMNPDRICTMNCVAGCNCKKGYVRNLQDNTCIKPEQCPTKKCPGPNEELNYCASYCPVTCANRFTLGDWSCITLCREACDCISGTLRSDNGTCVPIDQCSPPVCRQNEKYMKCGTACPLTCDNYKTPPPCTRQCVEDCFCEDGHVRDRFNRCVKPENCEPICPAGEKFSECSAHCQDTCENYNVTNRICTRQCQSGCVCEQGTVRRTDGKCVPPSECTQITCPADEVYDPCSAHCEDTCDFQGPGRPCTAICIPGCRCGKGLVRRSDGKCVKFEQCPPPCPPSEHYDECNAHCEDTCELHGSNVTCLPYCNAGCRCNDGLVRKKDGQCVNLEDCSALPCSDTEVYDPCSSHCEPTCESNGKSLPCATYCEPGCRCKAGLVRRKDKQCVKLKECQNNPQCGVNERWVGCVLGLCIPLTCDQLGYPIACPGIIGPCEGGCVCAENYVKDSNNICIPQQDCPSCGNDFNATVGCGVNCGRLCTNYQNPPNCATPQFCNFNGCDCKEGYVFDTVTERCVAPVDCPIPCNGDLYAEKVKCPNPCPPTCAKPTTAVCNKACLAKGCQCRLNFVLDANGKCVKPEDCPTDIGCNGDPNAHISSCASLCQPTCSGEPRFCPAFCRLGCACNTGYVLTEPGGVCIKPEQCVNVTTTTTEASSVTTTTITSFILCPQNEIWIDCKAGYCKPQYCRDVNMNLPCPLIADPCPGGCICRDGLLRNEEGVCIPKNECPTSKPCSDPNAIRKKCASHESCRATCAVPNSRVCPKICIIDGCECKQGYILSKKGGKCVRIEDCPRGNVSCNGDPNAVIQAFPPPCPSTCDLPNGIPNCLKLGLDVGCQCIPGYILSAANGKCILPDQCKGGNPCGANATFSWCRVNCPYDYCPVDDSRAIIACDPPHPCPSGCVCKLNHKRKSEKDDRCIISSTCPPVKCTRPNEVWDSCPSECRRESCADVNNQPTTCNTLVLNCQPQCICKKGYFRNDSDICIPAKDCPNNNKPCDDPNAERLDCAPPPSCRSTCARPNPSPCILSCAVNECVCKKGFVLSAEGGKCIPVDQCPINVTTTTTEASSVTTTTIKPFILCPQNEIWIDCKAGYCKPQYCRDVNMNLPCPLIADPCPGGCICRDGLLRNEEGVCIPRNQCPTSKPCSDPNAIRKKCASHESCRATCAVPNSRVCPKICIIDGCECKQGYVLSKRGGKCVRIEDCPRGNVSCNGDPNAVIQAFPPPCPSTCDLPNGIPNCLKLGLDVGCQCKPGYLLSAANGKCILPDQCKGGNPCGANATFSWCRVNCPYDYCPVDDSRAIIACDPPHPCPSGCVCKLNHKRKSEKDDRCIISSTCPPVKCTRPNEVWDSCPSECRRESCADVNNQPTTCNTLVLNCQPQCICKKGYFRNDSDICIPAKDCPNNNKPCDDPNAERLDCAPPPSCRSTCARPNPSPCILSCAVNECVCKKGFVLSAEGGKCIPVDQCPKDAPCNGDSNAVIKANPIPCPSTCSAPNASPWCKRYAPPVGCECKPGYLQADNDGKCIKPDECPGGNPCGANGTFVWCRVQCPYDYCPVNDNRGIIACDRPFPCPSGCICKLNHKRRSTTDDTCILSSTCPPVTCTRPNEVWDPCTSQCRFDSCRNVNQIILCKPSPLNCQPRCVCKKGHYRNDEDVCVPKNECPNNKPCNDPNAERLECAPHPSCRSTCATPNPGPCIMSCAVNQCVCKKGFVLSDNGKCISVDQCPKDAPCNGDSNAVIKLDPIPCPSTCSAPNASPWCKRYAPPVGCECKPGYIQAEDGGKCIKPDECPGGNPCGINGTFASCSVNCPTENCPVSDSRAVIACSIAYPCPSGCACKLNYKRKSSTDYTCILASDCPPVNCTRPNEVWSRCPSDCLREYCADVDNQPTTCNTLLPTQCQPQCVCKKGYFRNDTDICIPARQCPNKQKCSDPNAERVKCAPATQCRPTCAERNPGPCIEICIIDDCVCKKGFILSEKNGTCIPENQCPAKCSDPNAERVSCGLNPECRATCTKPNPGPCLSQICIENSCVCKKGYVLAEKGGKCVAPEECPIQKSCNGDPNAQIKVCPLPCPATCDAPNAIPCRKACVPIGCECKDGYILSETNGKCILPEKCKGGNPCGRNETFVSCKVPCPSDYCPTSNNPSRVICETPNPCLPGCVCNINYRRRSKEDQRCMYASECPPQKCNKNEVWSGCPSECLQEDCSNKNDAPVVCNTLLLNCQPKCICKRGYYRDSNRNCVPANQCPKPIQCKANEVYRTCRNICPPQTCVSIYSSYDCTNATQCEPGCDCLPEYLRNGTDKDPCIPSNLCPINGGPPIPDCGINEHYETDGTKCDLTCKNYDLGAQIGPCEPRSGCFCDDGHVRNSNGLCIPKKKCPKNIVCKKNEVLSECYNSCHRTCKTRIRGDGRMCSLACVDTGCLCIEGHLRHDNGTCVPISECSPPQCHENETYSSCGSACPATCQNRGDTCSACTDQCVEDCFCSKGYVRAEDGTCVKPKDCPNNKPCDDPNAERLECAPQPSCRSTCATPNPGPCILSCAVNQCVCKTGFVLSEKGGKCVPVNQCPKDAPCNGDSNSVIKANPIPCPSTCSAPNASPWCKRYAPPVGCECKPGYLQAENGGKCIKPDECPGGNPCGVNGTFVWCAAGCPNNNCPVSDSRGFIACSPPNPCPNGCACKQNFKRRRITDDSYTCILASDCPPVKCTRQNEEWSSCPSDCLREDCVDVDNQPTTCNTLLPSQCRPRCICKKGYFRNDTGLCVPAKQCRPPPTCPKGEVYNECGSSCPPSCQNKGNTCLVCTLQCVPGCYCAGKTIRAPNGTCVLPENCPPRTCTGQNEYFDECPPTCPRTQNCSNIWSKIPCEPIDCCEPQCRCKSGYFRNELNKCVSGKECSQPIQCKGNEVYRTCRIICPPQTCASIYSDYDCRNATQCEPGCDCLPEYLRNGTDKDPCIPSNLCPINGGPATPDCGINEHYETDGTKCDLTCKNYDLGAQIGPCEPRSGCFCDDGHVRNSNGLCIPKKKCPKNIVCKKNEVLSECYNSCHRTCKTRIRGDGRMCSLACVDTGCLCIEGYLRHDNGTCVPISECSPPQCHENETYSSCGSACPATCQNRGDTCSACTDQCVEDCFCSKEYVRAEDGTCVKPKDCPPRTCDGPNEHFDECPPTCPPTDGCSNIWSKFNCTNAIKCCKPQCRCNSGSYRKNGICVPVGQCTSSG